MAILVGLALCQLMAERLCVWPLSCASCDCSVLAHVLASLSGALAWALARHASEQ